MENTKEEIKIHQDRCNVTRAGFKEHGIIGPWMDEPDRVEFKAYGLDCLLVRNPQLFNWCGYVGVSKDHPASQTEYDDVDVDVHGGLTYSKECEGHICHLTEKEDNLHWLGFDCAHWGDLTPGVELSLKEVKEKAKDDFSGRIQAVVDTLNSLIKKDDSRLVCQYRDIHFVMEETKNLARQLSKAA